MLVYASILATVRCTKAAIRLFDPFRPMKNIRFFQKWYARKSTIWFEDVPSEPRERSPRGYRHRFNNNSTRLKMLRLEKPTTYVGPDLKAPLL